MNQVLTGSTGRRALHVAADYGQAQVIQYLLELNADVNVCMTQSKFLSFACFILLVFLLCLCMYVCM